MVKPVKFVIQKLLPPQKKYGQENSIKITENNGRFRHLYIHCNSHSDKIKYLELFCNDIFLYKRMNVYVM